MTTTALGTNIGFETGDATGWTLSGAVVASDTSVSGGSLNNAAYGTYLVTATNTSFGSAIQTIDVSSLATDIDTGEANVKLVGSFGSSYDDSDMTEFTIDFLDTNGDSISSETTTGTEEAVGWYPFEFVLAVPVNTRSIKLTIGFDRNSGTNNNCCADIDSFEFSDTPYPFAPSVQQMGIQVLSQGSPITTRVQLAGIQILAQRSSPINVQQMGLQVLGRVKPKRTYTIIDTFYN